VVQGGGGSILGEHGVLPLLAGQRPSIHRRNPTQSCHGAFQEAAVGNGRARAAGAQVLKLAALLGGTLSGAV
jgi:hypothetical protein